MTRLFTIAVLVLASGLLALPATAQTIRGVVRNDAGDALASAHVLIMDRSQGTITNMNGEFEISAPELPTVLEVRHIGYRTASVRVEESTRSWVTVVLEPSVYSLDEIIVADRDFAENVVRRVIRKKLELQARLPAYKAAGYTRITLDRDEQVTAIHEAVFDLYGSRSSDSRAVVRSIRETSGIHEELGFLPAGMPLANFYADTVLIRGLQFVTPTHPQALDYYTFSFGRTRSIDDRTVYDLYVAPRTSLYPAFIGVISVLAEEHVLIGVELRPARFVALSGSTTRWDVFYRQQFFEIEGHWLPADLRLSGSFDFRQDATEFGPVGFEQTSLFSTYAFDPKLTDLMLESRGFVVLDRSSIERDYLFAEGINIVPLTPRETVAFVRLRQESTTLAKAYPPRRPRVHAGAFRPSYPLPNAPQFDWPRIAGYQLSAGLNRVDGYRTGIGTMWRVRRDLYLEWRLTQAFSLDDVRYHVGITRLLRERLWLSAKYTVDSAPATSERAFPTALTSLATQLGGPDYYDYHWSEDGQIEAGYRGRRGQLRIVTRTEKAEPLDARLSRAWPFRRELGPNPRIDSVRVNSISVHGTLGDSPVPFRSGPRNGITFSIEQSIDQASDEQGFTAFRVQADAYVRTLYRSRLRSNGLHVRVDASTYRGVLPLQRFGAVHTSLRGYSMLGVVRGRPESPAYAPRQVTLAWEHDFRGTPFEWLGLNRWSEAGVGLRLTGAHARAWSQEESPGGRNAFNTFHHEIGLSLTNPFALPVRLDVTVRLDDRRAFLGFGVGRF